MAKEAAWLCFCRKSMEKEVVGLLGKGGADVVVFRIDSIENEDCRTCRTGSLGA